MAAIFFGAIPTYGVPTVRHDNVLLSMRGVIRFLVGQLARYSGGPAETRSNRSLPSAEVQLK